MKTDRGALQDYAKRLIRILGDDMSRLADSGMLLRDGVRLPLCLEQYCPERERAGKLRDSAHRKGIGTASSDDATRRADGLVSELSLLESWVGQPVEARQPLLMLGLAGSGKSVMFAAFAIHLSRSLLKASELESPDRLSVPLPVRLRGILDFKADRGERQRFLRFMFESQHDLDSDDPDGLLDWPTFKELYDHKALVPLFDGFDELPGDVDADSNVSRRGVLHKIQSSCGGFFGLTSRLGYEAEAAIDETRHYIVRELTSSEVSGFIEHKFAHDERRLGIARRTRSLLQPNLDLLLQRPLFLVAWCELIPRDGSNAPEKLEAVMRELVLRCFSRRHAVLNLSTVEEDLSALGALLAVFADHGFDHNLDAGTLGRALASQPVLSKQAEFARTMDLALAAGFVVRMGEQLWYAVKIPVVEFLIGRSVAEDARRHPADPRTLIDRYRRWIWRPELHDVLDYTFDILWHGTSEQRSWAQELLQWGVDVARHDVSRPNRIAPSAHDDMHRSFAVAALRWHALHADPNDCEREAGADAARETAEVEMRLSENANSSRCMIGSPLPSFLLLPLLDELVGGSAHDILQEFLRRGAVANAASRVLKAEAAAVLDELRMRFEKADDDGKSAWLYAIEVVAGRLDEKEATGLVKNWILGDHGQDETNEERIAEHWAVSGAAERISEVEAKGIVGGLIGQLPDVDDKDEHYTHIQAIERAGGRIPQATASATINEWIQEFDRAGKEQRQGWLVAIESGIERVTDRDTVDLKEWVDNQRDKRFQISGLGQLDPEKLEQVWSESGVDSAKIGRSLQLEQWASQFRGAAACDACNELIRQGMSANAFRVARWNGDIAIISRMVSSEQGEGATGKESIGFEAALRKDLLLDSELVAAPTAVRNVLLGGKSVDASKERALVSGHADRPSGQGASPPSRTGESESARYVFRRGRADTWVFAFNSAPVTIGPNLKGFEYLARLISQPNREMSSIVLALAEQPADFVGEAERDKPDVILTKDQEEKLLDRRSQLEMQNVDRENPELERQIRIIDKYLNEAKSRRGKPGLVVEPRIKKAFKSVQNAITRALNALRKNGLGELADHLAPCSTPENYHFVYRQERPPMWDVGWSPRTDSK